MNQAAAAVRPKGESGSQKVRFMRPISIDQETQHWKPVTEANYLSADYWYLRISSINGDDLYVILLA